MAYVTGGIVVYRIERLEISLSSAREGISNYELLAGCIEKYSRAVFYSIFSP